MERGESDHVQRKYAYQARFVPWFSYDGKYWANHKPNSRIFMRRKLIPMMVVAYNSLEFSNVDPAKHESFVEGRHTHNITCLNSSFAREKLIPSFLKMFGVPFSQPHRRGSQDYLNSLMVGTLLYESWNTRWLQRLPHLMFEMSSGAWTVSSPSCRSASRRELWSYPDNGTKFLQGSYPILSALRLLIKVIFIPPRT